MNNPSQTKMIINPLPYYADCVTDELKKQATTELFEDEYTRIQRLASLRSKLKDEKHLRWQDDDAFLLSFLRARKFDVERAFHLIKGMYTTLGKHRNFFYNFSFERLQEIMGSNTIWFLPRRDDDNCIVLVGQFDSWDMDEFSVEEMLVSATIGFLDALRSPASQIAGFKIIVDFGCFSFNHLLHVSSKDIWFFAQILQNSVPIRVKGIHVINQNHFFTCIFTIFKQFISRKLKERVHVHGKNIEELHKFFNPGILPAEFGGSGPPFDNSEWCRRMEDSSDYIKNVLSFGYDKYCKKKSTD